MRLERLPDLLEECVHPLSTRSVRTNHVTTVWFQLRGLPLAEELGFFFGLLYSWLLGIFGGLSYGLGGDLSMVTCGSFSKNFCTAFTGAGGDIAFAGPTYSKP